MEYRAFFSQVCEFLQTSADSIILAVFLQDTSMILHVFLGMSSILAAMCRQLQLLIGFCDSKCSS